MPGADRYAVDLPDPVNNADRVGNSQQSNVQVHANTFAATTDVAIYESPFLPSGADAVDTSDATH